MPVERSEIPPRGNERHLLTDIRLGLRRSELRPVYQVDVDQRQAPSRPETLADLGVVAGRANLAQAIILRLLTPRGELAALGHPDYGSRLHQLLGRPNTENTRNLAKLYILEALAQEPRIEKVVAARVAQSTGARDRIDVTLEVRPIGATDRVVIGPFVLELGL